MSEMTLARGDKLVKLSPDGKPLTTEQQTYIEYEVKDLGTYLSVKFSQDADWDSIVLVLLRKVR
jgi:hypothetical protein